MTKNPIVINFEHVKLYDNEAVIFMPVNGKIMAFSIPAPGVRARFDREFYNNTKDMEAPNDETRQS